LEAAADYVRYVPTVSRAQQDAGWQGEVGRVEDVLRKYADELWLGSGELAAYLCGNPQMIEIARGVLQRARVAPEQIHTEQYFPLPKT
jgi:NAD(P)H-flavin reductase